MKTTEIQQPPFNPGKFDQPKAAQLQLVICDKEGLEVVQLWVGAWCWTLPGNPERQIMQPGRLILSAFTKVFY